MEGIACFAYAPFVRTTTKTVADHQKEDERRSEIRGTTERRRNEQNQQNIIQNRAWEGPKINIFALRIAILGLTSASRTLGGPKMYPRRSQD